MATELIELKDGLFVEVQADPEDEPRQIVAGATSRVDGALDAARGLLLKAVEPVASVWAEMNRSRPRVFISYSHDNEEHTERVRGLDASLWRDGCDSRLDIHKDTDEDWPTWMTRLCKDARYSL